MYYDQKALKKIKNKRNGKARKIWGWILLILGAIEIISLVGDFNIQSMFYGIIMAAIGAILLITLKKDVEKWDRYTSLINPKGNTSIKMIAKQMGVTETRATQEINRMIGYNFFFEPLANINAICDERNSLVVMTVGGVPMEPIVQEYVDKMNAEAEKKETTDTTVEVKKDPSISDKINAAIGQIKDDDVKEYIANIDSSVKKIEKRVKEQPELESIDSVAKLKTAYLPQTMELIEKYCSGEASDEVMFEIKGMLKTCADVFKQIERKLYEKEDADTLIDIEVMKQTFEREGLMASDFDIKLH